MARIQHGRAVRRIEPPSHPDLGGRPVLTLQAGSHREGSGASPGPVSTISAGQTGHFRLTRPWDGQGLTPRSLNYAGDAGTFASHEKPLVSEDLPRSIYRPSHPTLAKENFMARTIPPDTAEIMKAGRHTSAHNRVKSQEVFPTRPMAARSSAPAPFRTVASSLYQAQGGK